MQSYFWDSVCTPLSLERGHGHPATASKSGARTDLIETYFSSCTHAMTYTMMCGLIVLLCKVHCSEHSTAMAGVH